MNLQITSMADVFVILLVFLLKTYSSGAIALSPSKGLHLPEALGNDKPVEALKLEVSETAVLIEGKPASSISGFTFATRDVGQDGTSRSLVSALQKERAQSNDPKVKVDKRVIVIADERAPYSTIKTVLVSAAVEGYTDVKLAVNRAQ